MDVSRNIMGMDVKHQFDSIQRQVDKFSLGHCITHLPRILCIGCNIMPPSKDKDIDQGFQIRNFEYRLHAVCYFGNGHYTANIKVGNNYHQYDDTKNEGMYTHGAKFRYTMQDGDGNEKHATHLLYVRAAVMNGNAGSQSGIDMRRWLSTQQMPVASCKPGETAAIQALQNFGLYRLNVLGDGNCFFYSILAALGYHIDP